jgi:predicted ester cyclase
MNTRTLSGLAVTLALGAAVPALADDKAVVERFYATVLSQASGPDLAGRAAAVLAPEWKTFGNNSRNSDREHFVQNITGFGQAVPNLKWEIQDILRDGDRYVVRGRATGTPAKPFLGVEPAGKSFDIMSIDIHTVKNGKITVSYHIEDWAGAIRQLKAP